MSCLRDIIDLQSEWFAESSHRFEVAYDRLAGQMCGRVPWSWASLPGVCVWTWPWREVTVDRFCGHSPHPCSCPLTHRLYDVPGVFLARRPWLTSEHRPDGSRA